ncbi:MAG: hypothetical protein ACLFV2_08150 [Desulfurivibrionaceae bacterium]
MKSGQWRSEALVAAVILAGFFGIWRLWLLDPGLAEENRLLEWGQVIFLVCAAVVCLIRMAAGAATKRFFPFGFLFLFFINFVLREVDVEDFPLPDIVVLLGSGTGRNILLAVAWIAYLFLLIRRPLRLPATVHRFLTSRVGTYFTAGIICYLAAMPFDKSMIDLNQSALLFGEETLELAGTFLFFLATFWKGKSQG